MLIIRLYTTLISIGAAGIDIQLPKVVGEVTLIGTIFRKPVQPGV